MQNSNFFKENFIAVLGIALPLLLVALFALARGISDATVEPPHYKPVYAQTVSSYGRFRYDVGADKRLHITYQTSDGTITPQPKPIPATLTLFIADTKTGTVRKYNYSVADAYKPGVTEINTHASPVYIESQGKTSPDGYVYGYSRDGYSGGIVPEIFGYNRYGQENNTISKRGKVFPLETTNAYDQVEFIGWAKD